MRLFTAIDFSKNTVDSLLGITDRLRSAGVTGNYSRTENLHVTLAFIGETDKTGLIKTAMESLNWKPFELVLRGIGRFKSDGGDIIWYGIEKNEPLYALQSQLTEKLSSAGFKMEARSYTPHITLARKAMLPRGFELADLSDSCPKIIDRVSKIRLMKSERIGARLVYTEIHSVCKNNAR